MQMFQHVFSGDASIHGIINLSLGFKEYSVNAQVNKKWCISLQEKRQDCT